MRFEIALCLLTPYVAYAHAYCTSAINLRYDATQCLCTNHRIELYLCLVYVLVVRAVCVLPHCINVQFVYFRSLSLWNCRMCCIDISKVRYFMHVTCMFLVDSNSLAVSTTYLSRADRCRCNASCCVCVLDVNRCLI